MASVNMGLKEAVDIADSALASSSPRINVVKALREAFRAGAEAGEAEARMEFGGADETALERANDLAADLKERLSHAEARIDMLIATLEALATGGE